MASVQRRKPECPLCRASFAPDVPLEVNGELRDLVALLSTLHTVEQADGWQELAATKVCLESNSSLFTTQSSVTLEV
jgi:hypothetical protein